MLQAVLFDMDGLIFDTESVYKKSWQFAAQQQGLNITDDFYQQFIGVQDPECERILAEHFGSKIDMTRYCMVRDKHFHAQREKGIAYKPGYDALFNAIKLRGSKMAIVTSSHLPEVQHNFRDSEYLSDYELVLTAEDVTRGKPHPDCYQMAAQQLGLEPDQCLVLEDSNNGVQAGLDAGCYVVMIPDLLPPKENFLYRVTILKQLDDVLDILENSC
ncbi:hydrolase [Vibrio inusitatus NBRC 102082]|uniref:Hydrolase n=1 Tax=Vibrio inusitatus NBRC 102082 TaxID=1219070 RepID=A0A4Y3HXJ0_9VIBR|nr:HAD family phosphatase [Vibrio inusitatus]GEA51836.1 hydrolase [Vibrio inusitatus NBRC 102082]